MALHGAQRKAEGLGSLRVAEIARQAERHAGALVGRKFAEGGLQRQPLVGHGAGRWRFFGLVAALADPVAAGAADGGQVLAVADAAQPGPDAGAAPQLADPGPGGKEGFL